MPHVHTDREYEAELRRLRERLQEMAARVEEMIGRANEAVTTADAALARETILLDRQVNTDELVIDELCLRLLARWQPMASDLRFVTVALKIVTDLERMGDIAVNVCERAIALADDGQSGGFAELPAMGEVARSMLRDAMRALADGDPDLARSVIARDDQLDELYHEVFRAQLRACREATAPDVERCVRLQNVAKSLERIGDHCTNVSEQAIFLAVGKDVRHQGKRV